VRYYRTHSLDGATLFSELNSNKLRFNAKNEMTLICAKFDADRINISKVTSRKTKWPRFFGLPGRDKTFSQYGAHPLYHAPYWICCDVIMFHPETVFYVPNIVINFEVDWFSTF